MLMDSFDHKVQGTTSTGSPIYNVENTHSNGKLPIKTMGSMGNKRDISLYDLV